MQADTDYRDWIRRWEQIFGGLVWAVQRCGIGRLTISLCRGRHLVPYH